MECRGRAPTTATVDWKWPTGAPAERASLLLLDSAGAGKLVCLPGPRHVRSAFPGIALEQILDVAWKAGLKGGPLIAGWAEKEGPIRQLVLVLPSGSRRMLATSVRVARFSPDATALAYEVAKPATPGEALAAPTSYVLELDSGRIIELGALADPLWESDSKHLRATMLREKGTKSPVEDGHWTSLRVRWDRRSGAVAVDGSGSAQIPAPVGDAVAWSEGQRGGGRNQCGVFLNRRAGVKHSVVGRFCMGVADERGVRWSPDGRWLAFSHPEPAPTQHESSGAFVDVVSIEGGRSPALSALRARATPGELAVASAAESGWFDWSPSSRFLAFSDGTRDLRVYDFEAHGVASLGKGQRPTWSPRGAYLLVLAGGDAAPTGMGEAVVLPGVRTEERIDLGPVRDARWLPGEVCGL